MSSPQHQLLLQFLTVGAKLRMTLPNSPTAGKPVHSDMFGPAGSGCEP